jgi:hypothetical protein
LAAICLKSGAHGSWWATGEAAQVSRDRPGETEAPMRTGSILLLIWLVIGAIAAGQRDYYSASRGNCAHAGTIAVTILAGPLNYVGVNPKVSCHFPEPSQ